MKRALAFVALLLAGSAALLADGPTTGTELLKNCKHVQANDDAYFEMGFCLGYVNASWHTTDMLNVMNETKGGDIYCVPEGVTLGQVTKVTVKYMDEHPKDLHQLGMIHVLLAIRDAWPCKAKAVAR